MSAVLNSLSLRAFNSSFAFIKELFRAAGAQSLAIRLWTGETLWSRSDTKPEFTIVLKHPGALRRMFSPATELNMGEAYIFDDYDVEGDMEAAVRFGTRLMSLNPGVVAGLRLRRLIKELPSGGPPRKLRSPHLKGHLHSRERDRAAIRYHYDVSNNLYSLFLDRRMLYSAAHFSHPDEDLDIAQERKLEAICRRLRMRAGERFLDVGCGWGGLIIYAAKHYGVEAIGVTLSEQQAALANERIRQAGLGGRCRVHIRDYRDLEGEGTFHKIASIGMVEHVGTQNLRSYFQEISRLLASGGALLNSGIARPPWEPAHRKGSFTETYVFPDGDLETIPETIQAAEEARLELDSAENHRLDYAFTLRHWVRRLQARADDARRIADDVTYRIWRLYMAGSAARFVRGELDLLFALFSKSSSA
ncbi:MAG TPA: cyclopropane-fatty-acyl-phospholipid synthase family protein [Terriglobales bacterium]|nr:cyclopropane-fatty-acyl-phospholipid synthase family protein [Terriglobales bacterium]